MMGVEMKTRIAAAESLDEVKEVLGGMELDSERVWDELQKHRSNKTEKLDLDELESVSGGADRDWRKDGCVAISRCDFR